MQLGMVIHAIIPALGRLRQKDRAPGPAWVTWRDRVTSFTYNFLISTSHTKTSKNNKCVLLSLF
jgi:hypothetical protein